jgi:cyanophycinase
MTKREMTARYRIRAAIALILLAFVITVCGQERLLVIGGGIRPPDAMKKFVEWSGGTKSRILVITWASGVPEESFEALKKNLVESGAANIEHAPVLPLDTGKRTVFLERLNAATGIFFTGGDQNRIMDVLADEGLLRLIREKYARGTPFGGTSAGAAVISDPMMTGEADLKILDGKRVGVRKGLGLIPGIMFDQHFLVRQRHNRLFGFVMENPNYIGIGIDEDTAVMIEDNRRVTVAGKTQVMFVDARGMKGAMTVNFLKPGERFDLKKRKRS